MGVLKMENESLNTVKEQLINLGIELSKLESLSKILEHGFFNKDLKSCEVEIYRQ